MKSKKCGIRESDEQIRIFEFSEFHPKLRWMFAIPNGGYRDVREATRLKKQGVKSGVSDMFLPPFYGPLPCLHETREKVTRILDLDESADPAK